MPPPGPAQPVSDRRRSGSTAERLRFAIGTPVAGFQTIGTDLADTCLVTRDSGGGPAGGSAGQSFLEPTIRRRYLMSGVTAYSL